MKLRKICLHYGEGYFLRLIANTTFLLLLCLFGFAILFLFIFGVIDLDPLFQIVLVMDTLVLSLIFLTIMYQGACLNEFFFEHKCVLK